MHQYDICEIARKIRGRRQALGLSQEEVAELANLHRTYIGAVERAERNLTLKTLYAIANALGTNPAEFLS
tara:strand:- start:500 stop:709 length:210 start_codon:yes stop_codon:yes gene_type:complete